MLLAYEKYHELSKKDVIYNHYYEEPEFVRGVQNGCNTVDELSFIAQNVKNVRYLYFRNRGFLYYNLLKQGSEVLSEVAQLDRAHNPQATEIGSREGDIARDLFYAMTDDFVNCLVYQEADESLLRLLYDIFEFMGFKRLAIFSLEYALTMPEESDDVLGQLKMNDWVKPLWKLLKNEEQRDLSNLAFLEPIKRDISAQIDKISHKRTANVLVKPGASWLSLVQAINLTLKQAQDKERVSELPKTFKFVDPYVFSDNSMDDVQFVFADEPEPKVVVKVEPEPMPEPEPDPKTSEPEGEKPEKEDKKTIQRMSRRLNLTEPLPSDKYNIELTRKYFVETDFFFESMNKLFSSIYETGDILGDVVGFFIDSEESQPTFVKDFVDLLNGWNKSAHDKHLLVGRKERERGSADSDKIRLLEVLTHYGNQDSLLSDAPDLESVFDSDKMRQIVLSYNDSHLQMNQLKMHILTQLLGADELITKTRFGDLYSHVKEWVLQLEQQFLESELKNASLSVTIYEILVDSYIELKVTVEKWDPKGTRPAFNAAVLELLRLEERVKKWEALCDDFPNKPLRVTARFLWACNYKLASQSFTWREKKFVVRHLQELNELLRDENFSIPFPNYKHIADLNPQSIQRKLTTCLILSIFSKILFSQTTGHDDTISLLENILIQKDDAMDENDNSLVDSVLHGAATLDSHSLKSVREFLDQCPIHLKLSLWNILFQYYKDKGLVESYQRGFEQSLSFLLEFLSGEKYHEFKGDKFVLLLNTLNFFESSLDEFLQFLKGTSWNLPGADKTQNLSTVKKLAKFAELFYCFSVHEEAAMISLLRQPIEPRSPMAFQKLKNTCVNSIVIMLIYVWDSVKESKQETMADLLELVHSQLGLRRLCDASNGIFLNLSEEISVTMVTPRDTEIAQLLACRYHYKVKINGKYPADHYSAKTASLNKATAHEIASFILPLCFRENPLIKPPKNDLKQVIDDLFEVIGDPSFELNPTLARNHSVMEKFLELTCLDQRFVKESFHGLRDLTLEHIPFDGAIHGGLYFLEAVLMFNSYKVRKKSAQGRIVELERIIVLLKNDLSFGTGRLESWILLGQAYGFIVEDDLLWTSDKLNTIDRKAATGNIQRKSLLCYFMAVNTLTKAPNPKPVMGLLMGSLVKELYGAIKPPMDMIAFKVHSGSKLVKLDGAPDFQVVGEHSSVSLRLLYKLMKQCAQLAIKAQRDDWSALYYLGKIEHNLRDNPKATAEVLLHSSDLLKAQSTPIELTLEPSYKLCSLMYKYVKADKLNIAEACSFLERDQFLLPTFEPTDDKKVFYQSLLPLFQKLITLDKRAWYHKPHYRMAKIYKDDLDDTSMAKEIMTKFFAAKGSSKTFLQLWKPEFERPGKHFVYMYQYTQFYIDLLTQKSNLSLLAQLFPKLRKANSTMISLNVAWESVCLAVCNLVRYVTAIEDNSVDFFLFHNSHQQFTLLARKTVEAVVAEGITDKNRELLCYLYIFNDMKKQNNGFGPASLIDDTLCALFIMLHKLYTTSEAEPNPGGKLKRMAKKDFFPFTNDLVGKCKKDIETLLKDTPNLLNGYIPLGPKRQEERKRIRMEEERQRLEEEKRRRMIEETQRRVTEQMRAIEQQKQMAELQQRFEMEGKAIGRFPFPFQTSSNGVGIGTNGNSSVKFTPLQRTIPILPPGYIPPNDPGSLDQNQSAEANDAMRRLMPTPQKVAQSCPSENSHTLSGFVSQTPTFVPLTQQVASRPKLEENGQGSQDGKKETITKPADQAPPETSTNGLEGATQTTKASNGESQLVKIQEPKKPNTRSAKAQSSPSNNQDHLQTSELSDTTQEDIPEVKVIEKRTRLTRNSPAKRQKT